MRSCKNKRNVRNCIVDINIGHSTEANPDLLAF